TFTVNLTSPTNATIATAQGMGTILNDDAPLPTLSINNVSLAEGNSGVTFFVFSVQLSSPSAQTISFHYATADGTATTADGDYQAASGNVSIIPGETTDQISIAVDGDLKFELDESFTVNLSAPVNDTIAQGTGTATI